MVVEIQNWFQIGIEMFVIPENMNPFYNGTSDNSKNYKSNQGLFLVLISISRIKNKNSKNA